MENTKEIREKLFNEIIKIAEYNPDVKKEWNFEEFDKFIENIYNNTSLFKEFEMYDKIYKFPTLSSNYRNWVRAEFGRCIDTILNEFMLTIKGDHNGKYWYQYITKFEPKVCYCSNCGNQAKDNYCSSCGFKLY